MSTEGTGGEVYPTVTVLTYHDILPEGLAPEGQRDSIPIDRLRQQIDTLLGAGMRCVSLADAIDALAAVEIARGPERFALTFDDGYSRLHEFLPAILKYVTATLFLLPTHTGRDNSWNTRAQSRLVHMDVDQLQALADCGASLQFHGLDHHNMLKFANAELRLRWERGISWFRDNLRCRPVHLSYPYGYCDDRLQRLAAEYFQGAVSVTHGSWSGQQCRYALNRLNVPSYFTGRDLLEVIRTPPSHRWLESERRAPWRRRPVQ
jgi:peptidoglycan/xylan/chitin deacetylase (PgdA/CDA1 family)